MTKYEKLIAKAASKNINVIETSFESSAKGFCIGNTIAIRNNLSEAEKTCIFAEELGHYITTTGNILDQNNQNNRKQEKIARKWAINFLISINDLINAYKNGCFCLADTAEYLNVTEEFIFEAIAEFKSKYGVVYTNDNYIITFNDLGYCVSEK